VSTGGVSTGGTDTGGVSTGGTDTGGVSTGGVSTGGTDTGGVSTGGVSTGGTDTGGVATGGVATGGEGGAGGAGGAAPFCQGSTAAFCDDFEDGNSNGWVPLGTSSSNLGTWTVKADTGFDGSATLSFQEDVNTAGGNYHYQLASGAGVGPWLDQTVTAYIKLTTPVSGDNNKVGICARMSGTNNNSLVGYCLFLRAGQLQLSRKAFNLADAGGVTLFNTMGGTSNPSGGTVPSFAVGSWYKVALQVANVVLGDGGTGVQLTGYVDGVALIQVVDGGNFDSGGVLTAFPVSSTGFAAVVTRSNDSVPTPTAASFDNVTVTSP
jgi:hypothetical protein